MQWLKTKAWWKVTNVYDFFLTAIAISWLDADASTYKAYQRGNYRTGFDLVSAFLFVLVSVFIFVLNFVLLFVLVSAFLFVMVPVILFVIGFFLGMKLGNFVPLFLLLFFPSTKQKSNIWSRGSLKTILVRHEIQS